jgi:hypothetical protein
MSRRLLLMVAFLTFTCARADAAVRSDGSKPAVKAIVQLVTHVPASTLNRIGAGTAARSATRLEGTPLLSGGKPELLTVNMAWCPHCAANSWALAVALSRFGTFTSLRTLDTGTLYSTKYHANPGYPHARGLSFLGSGYRSRYLKFKPVVLENLTGGTVQRLTSADSAAMGSFDPRGSVPAIDVGGRYGFVGSSYSPQTLIHVSWLQIARVLANPDNPLARAIDGQANTLTAAICATTKGLPVDVCSSAGVVAGAPVPTAPQQPEGQPVLS